MSTTCGGERRAQSYLGGAKLRQAAPSRQPQPMARPGPASRSFRPTCLLAKRLKAAHLERGFRLPTCESTGRQTVAAEGREKKGNEEGVSN